MLNLYNADCLEKMKEIPAKSIDLILCDLPYGLTMCKWDKKIDLKRLWEQYERIIKDNGVICLFGQTRFYNELVESNKKLFRYDLVWDKVLTTGFLNANRQPLRKHEQIAVFYKHQPKYNPPFKNEKVNYSKENVERRNKVYRKCYIMPARKRKTKDEEKYPTSILQFKRVNSAQMLYPTEKPIELLEYLIRLYTDENDLVLDNCMGSGTTGMACKNTNRNFIGIEISKEAFQIAKNRLNI